MKILGIAASASEDSGNYFLLNAIAKLFVEKGDMEVYQGLYDFDLFTPKRLKQGTPENIQGLKDKIIKADLIVIATPEYTHNIPAVLKNLIEWCTHSGEFSEKMLLPITFTPHAPRGEHAMSSLLASLKTVNANILTTLPLYRTDVTVKNKKIKLSDAVKEMLTAAFDII